MNTIDLFKEVVDKNDYVKKSKNNKNRDKSSLCYIINRSLSQSENIRMGTAIEKIAADIIKETTKLHNIKSKNKKGVKERDHLWLNDTEKIIYYAEFKSNINLDTEKSKATIKKISDITKELKTEFSDYKVKSFLVAVRYKDTYQIDNNMKNKYRNNDYKLVGINNYFKKLGSYYVFKSTKDYSEKLEYLADKMYL